MRKFSLLMLAALFLMVSTFLGCNTTRGLGKDISVSGEHIQNIGK